MIVLDPPLKTLEVVLAAPITTNHLIFVASYVDTVAPTMELVTIGESDGLTDNLVPVTMVIAAAALTSRQIKSLSIYNNDTVAATVAVRVNNNGTLRFIVVTTLAPGSTLHYEDGRGWAVIDLNGVTL